MRTQDVEAAKMVRRCINRRCVDTSCLDIRVNHGVCYIRGKVERVRGYYQDVDLAEEMNLIQRIIHQQPGIREVVLEVQCPSS